MVSRSFKHWAVLCSLEDGQSFLLDAANKAGMLRGRLTVYEKNEDRTKLQDKISLGVHRLHYNDITEAFKEISRPEKYSKIENNCQVWVVDFLRLLKIPLPRQVKTIGELIPTVRLLTDRKKRFPAQQKPSEPNGAAHNAHAYPL
ncbi:hypothetical protein MTO96_038760 [Rhipicephalus appendiculatus]